MNTKPLKVLVVDDDGDLCRYIKFDFDKNGIESEFCHDVNSASEALSNTHFDCAVFDINLGDSSSGNLILEVRNNINSINYNIPIIVQSAFIRPETLKILKDKADGVLLKPLPRSFISNYVKSITDKDQAHRFNNLRDKFERIICLNNFIRNVEVKNDNVNSLELFFDSLEKGMLGCLTVKEKRLFEALYATNIHTDGAKESMNALANRTEEHDSFTVVTGKFEEDDSFTRVKGQVDEDQSRFVVRASSNIEQGDKYYKLKSLASKMNDDAISVESLTTFEELLAKNKIDLDARNSYGQTALMLAAYLGQEKIVDELLMDGSSCKVIAADGKSPLHFSAIGGNVEVIQKIINGGAKISLRDNSGDDPFSFIIHKNNYEAVDFFIQNQINLSFKNKRSETYLMMAVIANAFECFKKIVDAGASLGQLDNHGNDLNWYINKYQREKFQSYLNKIS